MGMSVSKNQKDSIKTIHTALDQGITLFNTGEFYDMGEREMVVGKGPGHTGGGNRWRFETELVEAFYPTHCSVMHI